MTRSKSTPTKGCSWIRKAASEFGNWRDGRSPVPLFFGTPRRASLQLSFLQLRLGFAQFGRALADRVGISRDLHIELEMKPAGLEQIIHAQQEQELVERLEQKIGRAGTKGAQ